MNNNFEDQSILIDSVDIACFPWLADLIDAICDVDAEFEDIEQDDVETKFLPASTSSSKVLGYGNSIEDIETGVGGEYKDDLYRFAGCFIPDFIYDTGWVGYALSESFAGNISYSWVKEKLYDNTEKRWKLDAIAYEKYEGTLFMPIDGLEDV